MQIQKDPVWDLILNRHAQGSKRGSRAPDDQAKLAIIMPGNGLGGSTNFGMICALEELGLMDSVDMIAGTSSGAILSPYAALNQARQIAPLFWGPATDKKTMNLGRFLPRYLMSRIPFLKNFSPKPVVDLDHIFDTLLPAHAELDETQLLEPNSIEIHLTAMRGDTHESANFSTQDFKEGKTTVKQAMRASVTLPELSSPPQPIYGVDYYDGVYKNPVPIDIAAEHGATHVLVLYPHNHTKKFRGSNTMKRIAFVLGKKWEETFNFLPILQEKIHQTILSPEKFEDQGLFVSSVLSPVKANVFDRNAETIQKNLIAGYQEILNIAGQPSVNFPEQWHIDNTGRMPARPAGYAATYGTLKEGQLPPSVTRGSTLGQTHR